MITLCTEKGDVKVTKLLILCIDGLGYNFAYSHTDHAYLGCTRPVDAKSVLEVRKDIERILKMLK